MAGTVAVRPDEEFVFPSLKAAGRSPPSASDFFADHLRPAPKKSVVHIEDGQRFGLHNLRLSLSNWLVDKAEVEPKAVQGIFAETNGGPWLTILELRKYLSSAYQVPRLPDQKQRS